MLQRAVALSAKAILRQKALGELAMKTATMTQLNRRFPRR